MHSENRREWLYSDVGAIAVRATTVGLYPTNPPPEVAYLLSHSGARVLIAEDQEQVDKALEVLDQVPDLEKIIYLEPRGIRYRYTDPKLMSWEEFLALGARHRESDPEAVNQRMAETTEGDVLTIVYTSGTTGPPKGAMLTVSNVEYCIKVLVEGGGFASPPPSPARRDAVLPAAVPRRGAGLHRLVLTPAPASRCISPSRSRPCRPTCARCSRPFSLGCPASGRRCSPGCTIRIDAATLLKRMSSRFWLRVADGIGDTLVRTGGRHTVGSSRLRYAIGWLWYYRALRERIGMRKVRHAVSAAAPIAPEVLRFFMGIGVPMYEAYGMTENTAIATANQPGRVQLGTVGEPHAGIELRIDDATGEILTRHPGTFAGYWKNPEATAPNHRRGRLVAHRRRRRVGRRHVREDHRPDEGHHHHRGRQERRAVARSRTRSRPRRTSRRPSSSATSGRISPR